MKELNFVNLGPIRDVPLQKSFIVNALGHRLAVFRETFGHCFVVDCNSLNAVGETVEKSRLDGRNLRFEDGKCLDLVTGKFNGETSPRVKMLNSWTENGFILVSVIELLNLSGLL